MSAQKSRYGGYAGSSSSPRRKICVTYTIRSEREPRHRSGVNRLRVDPYQGRLFTAGRDSIIRGWDLNDVTTNQGQSECGIVLEHHTDWVNDIVLCNKGSVMMSASSDTSLKVWDLEKRSCTSTLKPHKDYIQALAYSPQTETVVSAGLDHELYLWDINALTTLTASKNTVTTIPLKGQKESVYSVDINKQGTLVVSGSTEKALKVWDTRSYQKLMKLKGHTDNVKTVLLNEDGTECLSGSSDGTVRLWSIGQQRCIETFRLHEGGVWALEVDESFKYFYSSGKDCKVYLTDMTGGQEDSILLFKEDHSVLSLALDTTDRVESLWVSTSSTHVRKWPALARELTGNGDIEEAENLSDEDDPSVTDVDEITPMYTKPFLTIPGATTIVECKIVNNKREVLTKDSSGTVGLWDILHGKLVETLGQVDMEVAAKEREEPLFVPNWFSCDIKTGMLSIRLEENECFSAWVMGNNTNLPNTSDLKLNYGALMLKALFEHWPESYVVKQEQKALEDKTNERRATIVTCEVFVSAVETISDAIALGKELGLSSTVLENLTKEKSPDIYKQMYKYFQDDSLTVESLSNALTSLGQKDLVLKLEEMFNTSTTNSSKVDSKFFSVPKHTPIVLSEATDCGATLVRFTCADVVNPHENNLLKTYCPLWVSDIVAQGQLPPHPKMSFTLGKETQQGKDSKTCDRLSAQDILTVRKVLDYLYGKLYESHKDETTDVLEVYCQGHLLDPNLDMRTVRHTIWKSGGDMKLFYKIVEKVSPVISEENNDTQETNEEPSPPSK